MIHSKLDLGFINWSKHFSLLGTHSKKHQEVGVADWKELAQERGYTAGRQLAEATEVI